MSYVSLPTGVNGAIHDFNDNYYYGLYTSSMTSQARTDLWNAFLNLFYGSGTNASQIMYTTDAGATVSLSTLLTTTGTWPPAELKTYKENLLIEGLFASCLKSFFYDYAEKYPNAAGTINSSNVVTKFLNYLSDPATNSVAKKNNSILIWAFDLLKNILRSINEATPTKGSYLIAMTKLELKIADDLSAITYLTQSSSSDYGSQTTNMQNQQKAEVYRAYRSSAGKTGQLAQSMITTLRDQSTQQSQLMSTIIQTLESMVNSVIKK
jgi:hypothetical protein